MTAYHPGTQIKIRPCPFCQQHMYGTSRREVINERTGQTYTKWGHMCPHCDYWQFSRVPKKLYGQMERNHFHEGHLETSEEDEIPTITNTLNLEEQYPLRNCVELRFTCLFCSCPMGSVYRGEEENERTGQRYVKTRYYCRQCDYWQIAKIPRKLAESVSSQGQPILQEA